MRLTMKPLALLLASALTAPALAAPALAEQLPHASAFDARMRSVAYRPDDVVRVQVVPGAQLLVQLGEGEQVAKVAVSQSAPGDQGADVLADVVQNLVFLKATRPLPGAEPVVIVGQTRGGTLRRYMLAFSTVPAGGYYGITFTYPGELAQQRLSAAERRRAERAQRREEARERRAELAMAVGPAAGGLNWAYVAQGDLPRTQGLLVHDNGQVTIFHFSPGARLPAIFRIDTTGREETVNEAPAGLGNQVVIAGTARQWRLRWGEQDVLGVYNVGYTPAGWSTQTGTLSPAVARELRGGR